jgi:ferric-dicitrate binding protein FerR (iron transport regulator)
MTLHNPSRLGREHDGRQCLLSFLCRLRPGAWQPSRRHGPGAPATPGDRRRLAALDRRLAAEAPALASMYAMFGRLTGGERPTGIEALTTDPPRRRRPHPAHVAVVMALAAVIALCVTLSTQLHPGLRSCPAGMAVSAAAPAHTTSCSSYATNK